MIVTVADTTLYHLAAEHLGDPLLWTEIAAANDLTDPWVDGIVMLTIPPAPRGVRTGGVPRV